MCEYITFVIMFVTCKMNVREVFVIGEWITYLYSYFYLHICLFIVYVLSKNLLSCALNTIKSYLKVYNFEKIYIMLNTIFILTINITHHYYILTAFYNKSGYESMKFTQASFRKITIDSKLILKLIKN